MERFAIAYKVVPLCGSRLLQCVELFVSFPLPWYVRWQGGMGKTAFQLQQTLGSLDNLSPVYLKAYRVSNRNGGHSVSELLEV